MSKIDAFREKYFNWSISKTDIEVYGKIMLRDIVGNSLNIQISIVDEEMLKLDEEFFSSDNNSTTLEYRPYFFDFFADIDFAENHYVLSLLHKQGNWIKMSLKLSDYEVSNDSVDYDDNVGQYKVMGNVVFGASPIEHRGAVLIINEVAKIVEEVEKTYRADRLIKASERIKYNKDIILAELDQGLKKRKSDDVSGFVYSVGHGNFICINIDDFTLLFDIGMSYRRDEQERINNLGIWESVNNLKPEMIILSHWDIDHILGICALNQDIVFDKSFPWIAPDLSAFGNEITLSAYRLCMYLLKKSKLWLVPLKKYKDTPVFSENNRYDAFFSIWQGAGRIKAAKFTYINNAGLILRLKNQTSAMLFPGDCEYKAMPNKLKGKYDFVVAPHHGAVQKDTNGICGKDDNSIYVVTVGKDEIEKYPTKEFIEAMRKADFKEKLCTYSVEKQGIDFPRPMDLNNDNNLYKNESCSMFDYYSDIL